MNLSETIYVLRWLIRDTFRQSLASRLFWLMLAISAVCILFCFSVSIEGGASLLPPGEVELDRPHGQLTRGFGAFRIQLFRSGEEAVHLLEVLLAEWVAGAAGTLLALVWTAGFLPSFLEPSSVSVLLAKPVPRWLLLVGKYVGVLAFVFFQVTVFIGGTWLALGLRTGFWVPSYLLGIPLLLIHFAVIYSFSVLLAVVTRSTVACIFGSILFWFLCSGMNFGRHFVVSLPRLQPDLAPFPAGFLGLVEFGYWVLPKPADLGIILRGALHAGEHLGKVPQFEAVQEMGAFSPELSVLTSLLFALVMLAIAAREFVTTDY